MAGPLSGSAVLLAENHRPRVAKGQEADDRDSFPSEVCEPRHFAAKVNATEVLLNVADVVASASPELLRVEIKSGQLR